MKSCFVIPTVLALGSAIVWVDTSALAAEKPGPQLDASDMTTFTNKVGEKRSIPTRDGEAWNVSRLR